MQSRGSRAAEIVRMPGSDVTAQEVFHKEMGVPPTTEHIAEMGKLIEEMTQAGVLLATEWCQPSATGVRVRRSNGKVTVTDGPFTEAKELVAGFALFQTRFQGGSDRMDEALPRGRWRR